MPIAHVLLSVLIFAITTVTYAADWQYYGYANANKVDAYYFFDADGVTYTADKTLRVWVQSITQKNLEQYYKKHEKDLVNQAAEKLLTGYSPQFFLLESIQKKYSNKSELQDAAVNMMLYELEANTPGIPISTKSYLEIDCNEKRYRVLETLSYNQSGHLTGDSSGTKWLFIPPDSHGEWLSMMLCKRKP